VETGERIAAAILRHGGAIIDFSLEPRVYLDRFGIVDARLD